MPALAMNRPLLISLGIGALTGAGLTLALAAGLFTGIEYILEDLLFSQKPVPPDIVIVAIDNESLAHLGQWPWPRRTFAAALETLGREKPRAVGVDVLFADASRQGNDDDEALAAFLKRSTAPLIFPVEGLPLIIEKDTVRAGEVVQPLPLFRKAPTVSLGHVNLIQDADGVVRRFPLRVNGFNAFAYEIARRSGLPVPDETSLGAINRIVYTAPPDTVRRIPFWRLTEGEAPAPLAGNIVLIGVTAPDLHDEKPTPMSRGTEMPGVDIQANILAMLLSGARLRPLPLPLASLWLMIAALVPPLVFFRLRRSLSAFLTIGGVGAILLILIILLFERGIVVNIVHTTLAWILSSAGVFIYRYATVERDRREIRRLFGKYVSADVLEKILERPEAVKLGGEEREVTILFSDIRGFTTLSEKTTPTELVSLLNTYFTEMTRPILENRGVIDKYIGDAIMAFWGAPLENPAQADDAIAAALAMTRALAAFNETLTTQGKPPIAIGIGLYTGTAVVGNIGSSDRFDYTVIGDTVNVASRLEGLNKEFGTSLIVGETTKARAKGTYAFEFLGSKEVKGRKEPLRIYTVKVT